MRLAAARFQEAFLGDIDDKYLPALHALRLVVRAGPIFLGSYIFVYNLVIIAQNYVENGLNWLAGGHEIEFWVRWEPVFALLQDALTEPDPVVSSRGRIPPLPSSCLRNKLPPSPGARQRRLRRQSDTRR